MCGGWRRHPPMHPELLIGLPRFPVSLRQMCGLNYVVRVRLDTALSPTLTKGM